MRQTRSKLHDDPVLREMVRVAHFIGTDDSYTVSLKDYSRRYLMFCKKQEGES